MIAVKKIARVKNNEINIKLPKEFENMEVEIIILPKEENYELWKEKEINQVGKTGFISSSFEGDEEDYSKW
jgi:sporulation-control protein spo0M